MRLIGDEHVQTFFFLQRRKESIAPTIRTNARRLRITTDVYEETSSDGGSAEQSDNGLDGAQPTEVAVLSLLFTTVVGSSDRYRYAQDRCQRECTWVQSWMQVRMSVPSSLSVCILRRSRVHLLWEQGGVVKSNLPKRLSYSMTSPYSEVGRLWLISTTLAISNS